MFRPLLKGTALLLAVFAIATLIGACEQGPGTPGPRGPQGERGPAGPRGERGRPGADAQVQIFTISRFTWPGGEVYQDIREGRNWVFRKTFYDLDLPEGIRVVDFNSNHDRIWHPLPMIFHFSEGARATFRYYGESSLTIEIVATTRWAAEQVRSRTNLGDLRVAVLEP